MDGERRNVKDIFEDTERDLTRLKGRIDDDNDEDDDEPRVGTDMDDTVALQVEIDSTDATVSIIESKPTEACNSGGAAGDGGEGADR